MELHFWAVRSYVSPRTLTFALKWCWNRRIYWSLKSLEVWLKKKKRDHRCLDTQLFYLCASWPSSLQRGTERDKTLTLSVSFLCEEPPVKITHQREMTSLCYMCSSKPSSFPRWHLDTSTSGCTSIWGAFPGSSRGLSVTSYSWFGRIPWIFSH